MQKIPERNFAGFHFDNSYIRLPSQFYSLVRPTPVRAPSLIKVHHELANELGLDVQALESDDGIQVLAGNALPFGAEPLAQAYSGHQFGHLNPQLGDGRAILLGEIVDTQGIRRDVQLKGPGRTPYSRNGDGRAALGPVLREYLVSDAMYRLGIKTTRVLAAVLTGENVYRDDVLPGAILTRIASSHLRIGTFEYFHVRQDREGLRVLADYAIQRHYPECAQNPNPYLTFLQCVMQAQAELVASWLHVGFIHGVMNTDNMTISGETIDYGPCAFMDQYDPKTVFSSIDRRGRYAFGNQGSIALWNMARLAECLLPLIDENIDKAVELAEQALQEFPNQFQEIWASGMRKKLGFTQRYPDDGVLINHLLDLMCEYQADYTLTFRKLATVGMGTMQDSDGEKSFFQVFSKGLDGEGVSAKHAAIQDWLSRYRSRLTKEERSCDAIVEQMNRVNPVLIPRNYWVEDALSAAIQQGDYQPFEELLQVLQNPYQEQPGKEKFAAMPPAMNESYKTFCGT